MSWQRPLAQTWLMLTAVFFSAQHSWRFGEVTWLSSLHTSRCSETNGESGRGKRGESCSPSPTASRLAKLLHRLLANPIWCIVKILFACSSNSLLPSLLPRLFFWDAWRIISGLESQSLPCTARTALFPSHFVRLRMILLSWTTVSSNFPSTEVAVQF